MSTLSTIITPGNVLTATNTQTVTNKDLSSGTNTFPAFGDVSGPASSTDNAIARYDGTTGKLIQNSAVTIDDTTGSMTFTGSGARILGDFSNATLANRLAFQSSTTNGSTFITVLPNGTSTNSSFRVHNTSDAGNSAYFALATNSTKHTINSAFNGTGSLLPIGIAFSGTDALTIRTDNGVVFAGAIDETIYAVVDAAGVPLSPLNGTIQTWTLGASRTPTAGTWNAGESMTLMIADGTAYTVTWTTLAVTWVGGTAPTLATTGYTVIELWKVGSTIYGANVGNVS